MRTEAPNPINYKSTPEDAIRFAHDSIKHNNDQIKSYDEDIADLKDLLSTMEAKQKADPVAFKKEVTDPSKEMLKHVDDYLFHGIKDGVTFQHFLKDRGVTEYSKEPIYCQKSAWTGNSQDIVPEQLIDATDLTPRTNSALLDAMFVRATATRQSQLITLHSRTSDGRTSEWNPNRADPDLTDTPQFKANKFYGFKPHKKYILSNELLAENIYGHGGLAGMIQAICLDDVTKQVETEFLYGSAKVGDSQIEGARGLLRNIVDYRTAAEEAEEGAQPSYTEALKNDNTRNREVIQVIKSGVNNGLPTTNDDLIALLLTVKNSVSKNKYGNDLRWYMPVEVWQHLENRKDENGRPLFKKDLIDDLGYKLLGYAVEIVDNWVDPLTGTAKEVGILFGNMEKTLNRSMLHSSLMIDPFTIDGAIKYYQEEWDMSAVAENDALRAVAFTA